MQPAITNVAPPFAAALLAMPDSADATPGSSFLDLLASNLGGAPPTGAATAMSGAEQYGNSAQPPPAEVSAAALIGGAPAPLVAAHGGAATVAKAAGSTVDDTAGDDTAIGHVSSAAPRACEGASPTDPAEGLAQSPPRQSPVPPPGAAGLVSGEATPMAAPSRARAEPASGRASPPGALSGPRRAPPPAETDANPAPAAAAPLPIFPAVALVAPASDWAAMAAPGGVPSATPLGGPTLPPWRDDPALPHLAHVGGAQAAAPDGAAALPSDGVSPHPAGAQSGWEQPPLAAPSPAPVADGAVAQTVGGAGASAGDAQSRAAEAPGAAAGLMLPQPDLSAPTQQVTRAIATLPTAPGQSLVVQLHPDRLGEVRITLAPTPSGGAATAATHQDMAGQSINGQGVSGQDLSRQTTSAGGTSVHVEASRPETLALLQHDQSALHQALTQAGVTTTDRALSFSLSDPSGFGQGGAPGGGAFARGGERHADESARPDGEDAHARSSPAPKSPSRWLRAGINITA